FRLTCAKTVPWKRFSDSYLAARLWWNRRAATHSGRVLLSHPFSVQSLCPADLNSRFSQGQRGARPSHLPRIVVPISVHQPDATIQQLAEPAYSGKCGRETAGRGIPPN